MILRVLLLIFACGGSTLLAEENDQHVSHIACEGSYPHHLQGVCVDQDAIFWSFTTQLVKTDRNGKLLQKIPVANHHGDLCYQAGKLYVAVNLGEFNNPQGNADSWIYVYAASDLSLLAKHEIQAVFHGAGGIGVHDGNFFVVGGLPNNVDVNYVYEYDSEFQLLQRHVIQSGHTQMGIQTAAFAEGRWWFGCYGTPKILLVTDAEFKLLGRHEFDCSLGIVGQGQQRLLVASGKCAVTSGCSRSLTLAQPDEKTGLQIVAQP